MHKLNVFLIYFKDLSMRRSINFALAHQNGGFRSSEKIKPISVQFMTGQKNCALQVPSVVSYKALGKFSKALYGTKRGT